MFSRLRPALARVRQFSSQVTNNSPSKPPSSSPPPSTKSSNKAVLGTVGVAGAAALAYYWYSPSSSSSSQDLSSGPAAMDPEHYIPYQLRQVLPVTHNTAVYRFNLPHPDQVLGMPTTSFVLTKFHPNGESEKPIERPYTPTNPDNAKGYFDLLIKTYPNGKMSSHIASLKPGDTLDVRGPIVKYKIDHPNQHSHIAMIAGGTGITPMWQVLNKVLNLPNDHTKLTLIFGNLSEQDILLKKELDHLAANYSDRLKVIYTVDKPVHANAWKGEVGLIDKAKIQKYLPPPSEDNIKIFICGPPPMVKSISGPKAPDYTQGDLSGLLKDLGYSANQVFKF